MLSYAPQLTDAAYWAGRSSYAVALVQLSIFRILLPAFGYKNTTSLLTGGISILIYKYEETIWQAYASPASLGFPLSVPSACGSYEFFHLK